jgi:hypothetical protein
LWNNSIYSFHDLSNRPWTAVCDGSVESFDTSEWASSSDSDKRWLFVRLLKWALSAKLLPDVHYWKDLNLFAFAAPSDLTNFCDMHYAGTPGSPRLAVVTKYSNTFKGRMYAHYRHMAFQGFFQWLGQRWYLELGRVPGRVENENGAFFRLGNHQPVALAGDYRRNTPWTRLSRS